MDGAVSGLLGETASRLFRDHATPEALAAAERGEPISAREADDLVRQSELFCALVESDLGAPRHDALPDELAVLADR